MLPVDDVADEDAIALLADVKLHSLKATPGTIAPFAASRVEWEVTGPDGFVLFLENTRVAKAGSQLVTPLSTRTFRLRARSGRITRELGAVKVTVDASACVIIPVPNLVIQSNVEAGIDELLLELQGTTRRGPDVVTVDPSGIRIRLALKKDLPNFPNPDVDVDAQWRYRAENGQLVPDFVRLDVSISFPWYTWLIPLSYPGLPIAIDLAKESTRAKVRAKAVQGGEDLASLVPPALRILSAEFNPTNFEMLACPDQALHHMVLAGAPIAGTVVAQDAAVEQHC